MSDTIPIEKRRERIRRALVTRQNILQGAVDELKRAIVPFEDDTFMDGVVAAEAEIKDLDIILAEMEE